MTATWFQGPAEEFIEVSRVGFDKGVSILHFLGGSSVDVAGERADRADQDDDQPARARSTACWSMWCAPGGSTISSRSASGSWGIVRRQPIYEKDRIDPVDPAAKLALDPELLGRFPEGYRHLAYLQTKNGFTIKLDLPGLKGSVVQALYAHGRAWLVGAANAFPD